VPAAPCERLGCGIDCARLVVPNPLARWDGSPKGRDRNPARGIQRARRATARSGNAGRATSQALNQHEDITQAAGVRWASSPS
jgi:hypothetical protein